jgi:putative transposase
MPRGPRNAPGGVVYHVLNRGVGRCALFHKDADYAAFARLLREARQRVPGARLLGYELMPNHWHLALWPTADGELSAFVRWLAHTHTQRYHAHYHTAGTGHLYQGRFKSFPVQDDHHLLTVLRYVERNALRANLVDRAQDWRWGSLWGRTRGADADLLSAGPVPLPPDWAAIVNHPQSEAELAALRRSVLRSSPFGDEPWRAETAHRLGIDSTLRPRGRPRKVVELFEAERPVL